MSQWPIPGHQGRVLFQVVALTALLAAVSQVALGGVVRVTGSGLGCPDWPLCHGRLIPPFEIHNLIEYFHRLSAVALGLLVLTLSIMAWRLYRTNYRIVVASTMALALVFAAALLGGITVLTELEWWVVLVHLGLAETLVACLVVASIASWKVPDKTAVGTSGDGKLGGFDLLVSCSLVTTFALILAGSYMVGRGYGSSCASWPLCGGSLIPQGEAAAVHMSHRLAAVLLGALVAATAASAWSLKPARQDLRRASLIVAGLYAVQVLVGAATVWSEYSSALRTAHLATATLVWVSIVYLATLNFAPQRFGLRNAQQSAEAHTGLGRVAL